MASGEMVVHGTEGAEAGVRVREGFGDMEVMRVAETSQTAMAAQVKAQIEARFIVAMKMRRSWNQIRVEVNQMCDDPSFAEEALYTKPLGFTPNGWNDMTKRERLVSAPANWPRGFSIRAIEAILFEMGNVDNTAFIIYEDEEQRLTNVCVIDLERNTGYTRTVVTKKRVERAKLKANQEAISVRTNSNGQKTFLVEATADEVNLAEASGVSKAIRTMGERLIRPSLKKEWRDRIEKTLRNKAATDPEGEKKKLIDAFASKGVSPGDLEKYLEHSLSQVQPAELLTLRQLFTALSAGDITWREVMDSKDAEPEDEAPTTKKGTEKVNEILKKATAKPATTPTTSTTQNAPSNEGEKREVPSETAKPSETEKPETVTDTVREYDQFPDEVPVEDGKRIKVKGVIYTSKGGNWQGPSTETTRRRGQLNFE